MRLRRTQSKNQTDPATSAVGAIFSAFSTSLWFQVKVLTGGADYESSDLMAPDDVLAIPSKNSDLSGGSSGPGSSDFVAGR
jgi:hypothetical protein